MNQFFLARLYQKLANIRDDLPRDLVKHVGKLKEITGGSPFEAQNKNQPLFTMIFYGFCLFTCNLLAPFEDDEMAVWSRIKLRKFDFVIPKERRDKKLIDKLSTPEEQSAILNFAIEGLQRLIKNDWNFSYPQTEEEVREYYKRKSEPIWGFAQDCCTEDNYTDGKEAFMIKEDTYHAFKQYCKDHDFEDLGQDYFYKHFPNYVTVHTEHNLVVVDGKTIRKWCYVGVRLSDSRDGESPVQGVHKTASVQRVQGFYHLRSQISVGFCEYCGQTKELAYEDTEGHLICVACFNDSTKESYSYRTP